MKLTTNVAGTEQVRRMLLSIGQEASAKALAATVEDLETYVEGEVAKHNRTGALWRSITKVRLSPAAWLLGHDSSAPHALFVHWGTKPHTIRPKNKKALRWPRGGAFVFSKGVRHPGTKADPYLVRAAAQAPAIFERHVAAALARAQQQKG